MLYGFVLQTLPFLLLRELLVASARGMWQSVQQLLQMSQLQKPEEKEWWETLHSYCTAFKSSFGTLSHQSRFILLLKLLIISMLIRQCYFISILHVYLFSPHFILPESMQLFYYCFTCFVLLFMQNILKKNCNCKMQSLYTDQFKWCLNVMLTTLHS